MTRGSRWAFGIALVILATVSYFFRPNTADVLEKGFVYLESAYSNFSYDDPYVQYVYPGEALACGIPNCHLTYRLLDGYFAAMLLYREQKDPYVLREQIRDAENVFQDILPAFRASPISNVTTNPNGNGVALDTMCILGYLTRDRSIAEHVQGALDSEGNWIAETYYRDGQWRNIADETWCLRLFAATGVATDQLPFFVETQIARADAFIGTNARPADMAAVSTHILMMLAEVPSENFRETTKRYTTQLQTLFNDSSIKSDLLLQANIVAALRKSGVKNTMLDTIVAQLRSQQDVDGAWRRKIGDPIPVLTTASVLRALLSEPI